jgi:hypothetical protein
MTDSRSGNPIAPRSPLSPRVFLRREWQYLLILVLALFGIAYTSFSRTPMTIQ